MIPTPVGLTIGDNVSPPTLDATNDKAAVICRAPKTGNITKMRYYVYAKTGSPTYDARCETVSAGAPSGTLKTAGSNVSTSPGGTGIIEVTFGTAASVTAGDMIAGVLNATTVSGSAFIRPLVGFVDDGGIRGTTFSSSNIDAGGWSNSEHAAIALVYDDGTVIGAQMGTIPGLCLSNTIRSDTTPDEYANWFTADPAVNVVGVWIVATGFGNSDNDFDVVLYNAAGTAQQTININNTSMISNSAGVRFVQFQTPYAVAAGVQFGISLLGKQSAKGSVGLLYYQFGANADRVTAFGWTAYMRTRADAGSWTDYNSGTDYSFAMLIPIVETPTPSSSGGLLMPNLRGNFA